MSEAKKIPVYLDIREAGLSLEEVAVDLIRTDDQELTSHWYHSPLDVDLYVWMDAKKNVIKQQISILGQICEWNLIDGVKTGYVLEDEKDDSEATTSISYDMEIQKTSLNQTVELLFYAEVLPQAFRNILIQNFAKNPVIDKMAPEEVLSRYGDKPVSNRANLANFIKKLFK